MSYVASVHGEISEGKWSVIMGVQRVAIGKRLSAQDFAEIKALGLLSSGEFELYRQLAPLMPERTRRFVVQLAFFGNCGDRTFERDGAPRIAEVGRALGFTRIKVCQDIEHWRAEFAKGRVPRL